MITQIDQQLLEITISCQPTQTVSQRVYWTVGPLTPAVTLSASISLASQAFNLTSAVQYQPMQPVSLNVEAYIFEYLAEGSGTVFPGPTGGPISHLPNVEFIRFALSASLTLSGTAFSQLGVDAGVELVGYAGTLSAAAIATIYHES